MTLKPDPDEDEYGRVDLAALPDARLGDLLRVDNPMQRMAAAEALFRVDSQLLQERIDAVPYRLARFGHPRYVKDYPDKPRRALPAAGRLEVALSDAIRQRRSKKLFDPRGVTAAELSTILHHCYGVTDKVPTRTRDHPYMPLRAAPTSGGLSGEEVYVLAVHVEGLPCGLYHYNGLAHDLAVLWEGDAEVKVPEIWAQPDTLKNVSAILVVTIDLRRGAWKYHARYLRTALLDAGGIMGYAHLAAVALGLYANPLTGFEPPALSALLKIDGIHEVPAITIALGRPGVSDFTFPPPRGTP